MSTDDRIRAALQARAHQAPHPDHAGAAIWHGRRTRRRHLAATGVVAGATTVALLGLTVLRSDGDAHRVGGAPSTTAVADAPASATTAADAALAPTTVASTSTISAPAPSTTAAEPAPTTIAPTTAPAIAVGVPPVEAPVTAVEPPTSGVNTTAATTMPTVPDTTPVTDDVSPMGACGLPDAPAPTPVSTAEHLTLGGIQAGLVGRWIGTPSVPDGWFPIGKVWIDFRHDGTYASGCIDANPTNSGAFYYGFNCDCGTNRYALVTADAEGSAEGDIDISWLMRGLAPYTTRGELHRVTVTDTTLHFEFFRTWAGIYGPVVYDLERA